MARNLVNGTNIIIEESGDNINMNLSSDYSNSLNNQLTNINNSITTKSTYSTIETVVGTWIDRKPLYRKVYTGQMINTSGSTSATIFNIQDLNFDNIWLEEGKSFLTNSSETLPMNYYLTANDFLRTWINKSNNSVRARSGVNLSGYTYNIVLEYTKTTD